MRGPAGERPTRSAARRLALGGLAVSLAAAALAGWLLSRADGGGAGPPAGAPGAPAPGALAARAAPAAVRLPEATAEAGLLRAPDAQPAAVHDPGEPRRAARAGSEQAFLEAFLVRALEPGADPLSLAEAELSGDRPLAARLAALRGLVALRPPGWAGRLSGVLLAEPDGSRPAAELAEYALLALGDLAPSEAAARAALFEVLDAPGDDAGTLARRRSAAAALALAAPREDLALLAARLRDGDDAQLLAGVRAGLSKNPAAAPLAGSFPAAARPDPAAFSAQDEEE